MRRFVGGMCVVAFSSASALGGIVDFDPDKASAVAGDIVTFDVTVTTTDADIIAAGITTLDMFIGSDDFAFGFAYDPAFIAATAFQLAPDHTAVGLYATDRVFLSANNPTKFDFDGNPATVESSFLLGQVTVDTTGLPLGSFTIEVDGPGREALLFGQPVSTVGGDGPPLVTDPLQGAGTLNIVPEPASLALLGLGSLVALRRRRRSQS